jgi:hypothetical protein
MKDVTFESSLNVLKSLSLKEDFPMLGIMKFCVFHFKTGYK